ncbi:MAG: hypothetical protein J0647_03510 [Campylobacteraceae bacterium]|nr:hypothetical protein [Campylobacteraceae bacterium]
MFFNIIVILFLMGITLNAGTYKVCEVERVDVQRAKEAVETILISEPTNTVCMLQLANIYLKQGKIAKGFEILVDAYSIDPHNVQNSAIASVLPFALKVSNLKKQANKTNDKDLWNKLGDGYFEMGIFNEAVLMYKNSLNIDATQHTIRLRLSLALQKNCQTYSAIEELKKILDIEEKNIYANYYLAKILAYDVKNDVLAREYFISAKKALMEKKESFSYIEYTNILSDIAKELKEQNE